MQYCSCSKDADCALTGPNQYPYDIDFGLPTDLRGDLQSLSLTKENALELVGEAASARN